MSVSANDRVLDVIIRLSRAYRRAISHTFNEVTTARQASVLREIRAAETLSQVALARATTVDPSLLVRVLDDLEGRGLISRQRCAGNRREMAVSLTPQGHAELQEIDATFERLAKGASSELTITEKRSFIALAEKLLGSLARLSDEATRKGPKND
jgi:DNA-binding MarR family transcriptional regulator